MKKVTFYSIERLLFFIGLLLLLCNGCTPEHCDLGEKRGYDYGFPNTLLHNEYARRHGLPETTDVTVSTVISGSSTPYTQPEIQTAPPPPPPPPG